MGQTEGNQGRKKKDEKIKKNPSNNGGDRA